MTLMTSTPNYPGITSDNFLGSDASGADKALNRTLNVPNGVGIVMVERDVLRPTTDFTLVGTTITFLISLDNRARITVFR